MTHIDGSSYSPSHGWRLRDYDALRPVLFMHIPKTSGMALAQGLTRALKAENPVDGFDRSLFGHFEAYDEMAPELRKRIFLSSPVLPEHPEVVCAHLAYTTLRERYANPQCISFLREPISRLLSHWIYWRSQSDVLLSPWGSWGDRVREARGPLTDFLSSRRVACQTDNIALRMLLWPHPLIPDDDFISPNDDDALLEEALERMREFAYLDVIETPNFAENLSDWLGTAFSHSQVNETRRLPAELRLNLHDALSPEAFGLLEDRSRLDIELWKAIVQFRHPEQDAEALRRLTLAHSIARHAWILTTPPDPEPSRFRFLATVAARKFCGLFV